MFDIPERYKVDYSLAVKEFIPKDLKVETKKKIKSVVKEVKLAYQIVGEEIPSVINKEYRCETIQMYDICVQNIKDASFISNIYQNRMKSFCVLRIHDSVKEQYSFALKRLSQTEENQIVVTDSEMTEQFLIGLPDKNRTEFCKIISYEHILNKVDKVSFYMEMYTKMYLQKYKKIYANIELIMKKPIWYDEKKVWNLYKLVKQIVYKKDEVTTLNSNADKVAVNQEMKELLGQLEEL